MAERMQFQTAEQALLRAGADPAPVELINPGAQAPLLLVCEHAGREIPRALGDLGLSAAQREMHIAYDIGAELLARKLAAKFGCTLIVQRYSRLVIDCNRPPGSPQSIPEISDSHPIPGNRGLDAGARAAREAGIFAPYAESCAAEIARPQLRAAFSIHSFTPEMGGQARPWDIGFLFRHPASRGAELTALCRATWPELTVGDNQPYTIEDETDWFIPVQAEPRGLPHCLIELRNDHLAGDAGRALWADRLHHLITTFLEQTE